MWKRLKKGLIWSTVILCVLPRAVLPSQEEPKTAKKPQLIELQIKVTDKKDGTAIDNADVLVKWGEGQESDSSSAITNSKGIAKVKDVPRGSVVIRVIANGYKTAAPKIDLKKEGQPIKIELEKETQDECCSALRPASSGPVARRMSPECITTLARPGALLQS